VSANKLGQARKLGAPAFPAVRHPLRPVPYPVELPRPVPDPELHAVLADMQRRYRVQRERLSLGDDEPKGHRSEP
jgi:hypothetical protein